MKKEICIICKICNPTLKGNGYCAKHSTGGTSYIENLDKLTEKEIKKIEEIIDMIRLLIGLPFLIVAIPFILIFKFISGSGITTLPEDED